MKNTSKKTAKVKKVVVLLDTLVQLKLGVITAIVSTILSITSGLIFPRYALADDGRPVRRMTECGQEFFVTEPSVVKELVCFVKGHVILRDENGIPYTNDHGKIIKVPKNELG